MRHAGAEWTVSHRSSIGLGAVEDLSEELRSRPMALIEIVNSAGHNAMQALAVGQLESMTEAELIELVRGVLERRDEPEWSALLVTAPASAPDPVADAWRRAELEARRWLAIAGSELDHLPRAGAAEAG